MNRFVITGRTAALVLAAALLAAAGCEKGRLARRGQILEPGQDSVPVVLPSEFRVNVPDAVLVTTYGNSCTSFGYTEVTVDGLAATVEPYDWDSQARTCLDIGREFPHPAELIFAQPGQATICVIGLDWRDSLVTVEREVPVR